MKILINDFEEDRETYINIFKEFQYERNELIFCSSYEQSRDFIINYLVNKKYHIDLLITNDSEFSPNDLRAAELSYLKNSITASFSKGNFRLCSLPMILYSKLESKPDGYSDRYNSIIQKNQYGDHTSLIEACERNIKSWRQKIANDLDVLGLTINLSDFQNSKYYKEYYKDHISKNATDIFVTKTAILSEEFIRLPSPLNYDWIVLNNDLIEKAITDFEKIYKHHVKYDRKNNERTILHEFFKENKLILLRDTYKDLKHEENLYDLNGKTSEECDFILKTEYPEFLNTTFVEVKKEDVTFYVKKYTKRPQISSKYLSHLEQVWRYKEYTEDKNNQPELKERIGYETSNFDFVLLAGRLDEKLELEDKFDKDLNRMFKGIEVITYEELEEININYLDRFNRINK